MHSLLLSFILILHSHSLNYCLSVYALLFLVLFVFFLQVAQTIEVMSAAHPESHGRMLNSFLLERTEERWVEMNEVTVLKLMN